jgi:hypothetical protein
VHEVDATVAKVPGAQLEHTEVADAPVSVEYVPAAQLEQETESELAEK